MKYTHKNCIRERLVCLSKFLFAIINETPQFLPKCSHQYHNVMKVEFSVIHCSTILNYKFHLFSLFFLSLLTSRMEMFSESVKLVKFDC